MPFLPKPYPDEAIGSVIARGAWHSGLPVKALLRSIFGKGRISISFTMGGGYSTLANISGTDAEELLIAHTAFPYLTAFLSKDAQNTLKSRLLRPKISDESISALKNSATRGVTHGKVCQLCIREELETYGETYWHRQHLLPACLVCLKHQILLSKTTVLLRHQTHGRSFLRPHAAAAIEFGPSVAFSTLTKIAKNSANALNSETSQNEHRAENYKKLALKLGYGRPSGDIASEALCTSLEKALGASFLANAGCPLRKRHPWPSQMISSGREMFFSTTKHILLSTFLQSDIPCSSRYSLRHLITSSRLSKFASMDHLIVMSLSKAIVSIGENDQKIGVNELLNRVDALGHVLNHKDELPLTMAFLEEFRVSNLHAMPVGRGAFWRNQFREAPIPWSSGRK